MNAVCCSEAKVNREYKLRRFASGYYANRLFEHSKRLRWLTNDLMKEMASEPCK
jgi:hypothetical protein